MQAEGEGVEPIKALDRFRGGCRRQSACPSVFQFVVRTRKNPLPCDTGLRLIPSRIDQASQAQRHRGRRICRLTISKRPCAFWFAGDT